MDPISHSSLDHLVRTINQGNHPFVDECGASERNNFSRGASLFIRSHANSSDLQITKMLNAALKQSPNQASLQMASRKWINSHLSGDLSRKLRSEVARLERYLAASTTDLRKAAYQHPDNNRRYRKWRCDDLQQALYENPDLVDFMERNYFDKEMASFGQRPRINANGDILLLVNGKWHSWESAKKIMQVDRFPVHARWRSFQNGFEPWKTTDWTELKPFRVLPESQRPPLPTLEIVTAAKDKDPSLIKDHGHSWIRLVRPSGEVFSIGLYAPDEFIKNPTRPLKTLPGLIQSPDCYEFLKNRNQEVVRYPLTEEKMEELLRMIEGWQRCGLHYNALEQNCSDFVRAILMTAAPAGKRELFERHTDMTWSWFHELPPWSQRLLQGAWSILPQGMRYLLYWSWDRILGLALAPLAIALGGRIPLVLFDKKGRETLRVGAVLPSILSICHLSITLNHARGVRRWQRKQPTYCHGEGSRL